MKASNTSLLISFWKYLDKRHKRRSVLIFILMIIVSFSEVISIGAILPFLGVLTSPELVYQNAFMQPIIQTLELSSANQLVLPLTIGFIVATLIAGVMRITLLNAINHFERVVGTDLNIDVYRNTLYQSYRDHRDRNSSYIVSLITKKTDVKNCFILCNNESQIVTASLYLSLKMILLQWFLILKMNFIKYTPVIIVLEH